MRIVLRTVLAATVVLATAPLASAGPIFLTGHDPDFHAHDVSGPGGQDNLLAKGLAFATGGAAGKFLWVESRIPTPGGHRIGEAGLNDIGLVLGVDYDRANGAEFATANLNDYTAIVIASSFGGLMTRAELDALIARKTDIENFINAGGGLFANSECYPCGANLLAGPTAPQLFGYLPVAVSSIAANGPFSVTPYGASLGLTNADMNFPTHNSFGLTGGLNVVDVDASGNPTTLAGIVQINNGVITPVPEPGSLMLLGIGAAALVARMRRSGYRQ